MGAIAASGIGLAAAGSIASGVIGSSAAKKASKKQNKILKGFLAEEQRRNKLIEANTNPFITIGQNAIKTLTGTAQGQERLPSFRDSEGFAFQRGEIERQTRRALSLRGNLLSGAGIEAEQRAVAGLTANEVANERNLLLSLSQLGLNAAVQQGQVSMQGLSTAGAVSSNIGNSTANLTATRGQLLGQGIQGATSAIGGGLAGFGATKQAQDFMIANPQFFTMRGT